MMSHVRHDRIYKILHNTCKYVSVAGSLSPKKKHNIEGLSGSKAARFELMMHLALANSFSAGVLVAGTQSCLGAISANAGKWCKVAC